MPRVMHQVAIDTTTKNELINYVNEQKAKNPFAKITQSTITELAIKEYLKKQKESGQNV
jgi:hypothetical protein